MSPRLPGQAPVKEQVLMCVSRTPGLHAALIAKRIGAGIVRVTNYLMDLETEGRVVSREIDMQVFPFSKAKGYFLPERYEDI